MDSEPKQEITLKESPFRKLGYAQEFRQLLNEHPGIIKTTLGMTQKAEDQYNPPNIFIGPNELRWNKDEVRFEVFRTHIQGVIKDLEIPKPFSDLIWGRGAVLGPAETITDPESGLQVTALGKSKRDFRRTGLAGLAIGREIVRRDRSSYFKIALGDQAFFVKKSTATTNPGFQEFQSSVRAKEALLDLDFVSVVEAQLGYQDKHQSWFVSKWNDLESSGFFPYDVLVGGVPDDYGKHIDFEDRIELVEQQDIGQRVKQIQDKLTASGIDIQDSQMNTFYNPNTDKFLLLDVTVPGPDVLNQSR